METFSAPAPAPAIPWSPSESEALYHVKAWGARYFHVNERGHVAVRPEGPDGVSLDLYQIVQEVKAMGVGLPVLIRFQDLLHTRVKRINRAFREAIEDIGYKSLYQGVFPIKVNQLREVVEEVLEAGQPYRLGLECGSKAELMATLPYLVSEDMLLVCNGYKDVEMMRLLRAGQLLGKNVIPIMERAEELTLLRDVARQGLGTETGNTRPAAFGVRIRLSTSGAGLWSESGGEGSKFGLSYAELVTLVQGLRKERTLLDFKLLHYHLGSQLASLNNVSQAAEEAARVYAWLWKQGMDVRYVDIGGGLGVTYEAGNEDVRGGIDYVLSDYARAVVSTFKRVCDAEAVPHPILVSESGRAIAAYHSVLVTEVIGQRVKGGVALDYVPSTLHPLLEEAADLHAAVAVASTPDAYERLAQSLEDLRTRTGTAFQQGDIPLETRAQAEGQLWQLGRAIRAAAVENGIVPHPATPCLYTLDKSLADHYLCDFSVFRSMVDHWAIGQRFPVMPLHRLGEYPTERGTLVDLTCDSDGKVANFICPTGAKHALELHPVHPGEPYYLGVFLMGAYQDIMGDMHNLFGRVPEVHVYTDDEEPGDYYIEQILEGQNVEDILALVQYFPNDLARRMDKIIRREVKRGRIKPKEGVQLLKLYRETFQSSTYLRT